MMFFNKKHAGKRIRKIVFIMAITFVLSSCNGINSFSVLQHSSIQNNLKLLTSDEANGRLPGTDGNRIVGEHIKNIFESIGLEPYNDSHLFQYTHKEWKPLEEAYKMTIKFSNGEVLQCKYGEDFLENNMMNIDLKAKLTLDYNDENISNKIVLLKNADDIIEENIKSAKAILIPKSSFRKSAPKFEETSLVQMIQISDKLNKLIRTKGVDEIDISFKVNAELEEFPQNNIVGVIPGENRENAIVITAHYDHVGSNGEFIWRGAIDNGTGTAALIDIAEKLKKHSEKETLKQDIIFCAFNGEESVFQGSIPFVKDIQERYNNIYNINIDCVGIKGGGRLLIDGEEENSNELLELIHEHFENSGFETTTAKERVVRASDHSQFILSGINAIGLSQEGLMDVIHTLEDNIDKVDVPYIEKLSNAIVGFIAMNSEKTFDLSQKDRMNSNRNVDEEMKAKDELRWSEEEKLDYNQYKQVKFNDDTMLVRKNSQVFRGPYYDDDMASLYLEDKKVEEFYKIYSEFSRIEELGEYKLAEITVRDGSTNYIENPDMDKIYRIETKIENLEKIEFRFSRNAIRGKNQTYQQSIRIAFIVADRPEDILNDVVSNYNISDTEVKINDEVYYAIYRNDDNQLNGLYKELEIGNKIYRIIMGSDYGEDWQYENIEDTVTAYRDLGMADFIGSVVRSLSNNGKQ